MQKLTAMKGRPRSKSSPRLLRRRDARRLEIVRAAGRAFGMRGFTETGMRDIAAAADISPANLYNYFKGKQELLFFCQESSLKRMLGALEKASRSRMGAATKLRMVIESHLRCVLDEVEGSAAHLQTNGLPRGLHQRLVVQRDRYERGIRSLIVAGMRSGEFVPCDASLVTRAILGASNWSVRWFHPEGPLNADEVAREFARYLIRGLIATEISVVKSNSAHSKKTGNGKLSGVNSSG
jgi:AcrR family transcriptional regulator